MIRVLNEVAVFKSGKRIFMRYKLYRKRKELIITRVFSKVPTIKTIFHMKP